MNNLIIKAFFFLKMKVPGTYFLRIMLYVFGLICPVLYTLNGLCVGHGLCVVKYVVVSTVMQTI